MNNLGGPTGATWFATLDVDSNTEFIAGGGSFDPALLGSAFSANLPNPIIVRLNKDGAYVWGKGFAMLNHNSINTVKFDTMDESRFVAVFDQGYGTAEVFTVAVLNTLDCSNFNTATAYMDVSGAVGGLILAKSTSFIGGIIWIVGSTGPGNKQWRVIKLEPTFSFAATTYTALTYSGVAQSFAFSSLGSLIVGGRISTSASNHFITLSRIDPVGGFQWHIAPNSVTTPYNMRHIVFSPDYTQIFGCHHNKDTAQVPTAATVPQVGHFRYTMTSGGNAFSGGNAYRKGFNTFCAGLWAESSTVAYIGEWWENTSWHNFEISKLVYSSTSAAASVTLQYIEYANADSPGSAAANFLMNYAYEALWIPVAGGTKWYLAGQIGQFYYADISAYTFYSIKNAFITSSNQTLCCTTVVQQSPYSGGISADAAFTGWAIRSPGTITAAPGTMTFTPVSPANLQGNLGNLKLVQRFCPLTVSFSDKVNLPTQNYTIFDPIYSYSIPSATISTACTKYPAMISLGYVAPFLPIFTVTSLTRTFTVVSSAYTDAGRYNANISSILPSGQVFTQYFDIVVINPCLVQNITAPGPPSPIYILTDVSYNQQLTLMTTTYAPCYLTYSLSSADGSPYDSSLILSFNSTTSNITVFSGDPAKIGNFSLTLTGTMYGTNTTLKQNFTLQVLHYCYLSYINTHPIPNGVIDINEPYPLYTGYANWTQKNYTHCPDITYTVYDTDVGAQADTSVFSISTGNISQVAAQTSDQLKARLYNLRLVANVGPYTTAFEKFTIRITDNCASTPITSYAPADQTYYVMETAINATFANWTQPYWYCGDFLYAIAVTATGSGSTTSVTLTSPSSRTVQIYTLNPNDADVYQVILVGVLKSGTAATKILTVTILAPCLTAVLDRAGNQTDLIYPATVPPITFPLVGMNSTNSAHCQPVYTLTLPNGLPYYTNVISAFNSSAPSVTAYTSLDADVGVYPLNLTARFKYGNASLNTYFTLFVKDKCSVTQIISDPIANQFYDIAQPEAQDVAYLFWNQTMSCPNITYQFIDLITGVFPNPAIFTTIANNWYTIFTNNAADVGVYNLQIVGTVPPDWTTTSREFTLTITNICGSAIVTPMPINDIVYNIFAEPYIYVIDDWISSINQCKPFRFNITVQKLSPSSDPSFIQFNSKTRQFNITTYNIANEDVYTITVKGTAAGGANANSTFKLYVVNQCMNATLILPTNITNYTYIATDVQLTQQIPSMVGSFAPCPVAYSLLMADGSPLASVVTGFTYKPPVFTSYTNDNSLQGDYNLRLTGTLAPNGPVINSYDFTLKVVDQCYLDRIAGPFIVDQIFDLIFVNPLAVTANWAQTMPTLCPPMTISMIDFNTQQSPEPRWCTPTADNSFNVYTQDTFFAWKNYTIQVNATVYPYTQRIQNFTMSITNFCPLTIIYSNGVLNQLQNLYQDPTQVLVANWTTTYGFCLPFTYTWTITPVNTNGTGTQVVTFDPNKLNFTLFSQNNSDCGLYMISLTGTLPNNFTDTKWFNVTLINQCLPATLSNPLSSPYTYTVSTAGIYQLIPAFIQSIPLCPINYTLVYSNYSMIDPQLVHFYKTNHSMNVYTSDNSKKGVYNLRLMGNFIDGPGSSSYTFTLTVKDICTLSVITTGAIPFTIVDVSDPNPAQITTLNWNQSLALICPPITYSWVYTGGVIVPDPTIFTLNGTRVSAWTNLTANVGFYNIKVIGNVDTYATASRFFVVQITDVCPSATITPVVIPNQIGNINASPQQLSFAEWTFSPSICGNFTYNWAGVAYGTGNSSFLTLAVRSFTVYTIDILNKDTFTITINGTLPRGAWNITRFNLTMDNGCVNAALSQPAVQPGPYSYAVIQPTLNQILPELNTSAPGCQINHNLTNDDGSPVDPSIITSFNSLTNTMQVYTTDNSKVGIYNLTLWGVVPFGNGSSSYNFSLVIEHQCSKTQFNTSVIVGGEFDVSQSYPLVPAILNWTQEWPSICPTISYSLWDLGLGASAESTVFSVNSSNSINVYTDLDMWVGTYNLLALGNILPYSASANVSFQVNITNKCPAQSIKTYPTISQVYAVGTPPISFGFSAWEYNTSYCGPLNYTFDVISSFSPFGGNWSAFVYFNSSTRIFTVQTNDDINMDLYNITIIGTLPRGAKANITFMLDITTLCGAASLINPTPPLNLAYAITNVTSFITLPTMNSTISDCNVTYTLAFADGTPLNSTFQTFLSNMTQLTSFSNDSFFVGLYNLTLTGSIVNGRAVSQYSFPFKVRDKCSLSVINTTIIPGMSFDVIQNTTLATVVSNVTWTQSMADICPPLTYDLLDSDTGLPVDLSVFTFTPDRNVTVFSNDISKARLYHLEVIAYVGIHTSQASRFWVNLTYLCRDSPGIMGSTILDQQIDLYSGLHSVNYAPFSQQYDFCGNFTYYNYITSPVGLDGTTFISVNHYLMTFFFGTDLQSDVGTYNVTLVGQLPSTGQKEIMFKVIVVNPCDTLPIITPNYTGANTSFIYSYKILQTLTKIALPQFVSLNPYCLMNISLTLNDLISPYPGSFIKSYNQTTNNITVYSIDNTLVGIYNLTLTAYYLNGVSISRYNITLNVLDQCTNTQITSFPVDLTYALPMADPSYYAFFFSQSMVAYCAPISYTLLNAQTGGAIDPALFNWVTSDTISIQGTSVFQLGTYKITILACVGTFACKTEPMTVTFYSNVDCSTPQITASSVPSQRYTVKNPILYITFSPWVEVTGFCGQISYYYTATAKGNGNPGIIAFSSVSRTFSIFTTSNLDVDVYTVSIIGSLPFSNYIMKFTITVNPFICNVVSMSAPTAVKNYVYYIAGDRLSIQIPNFVQNPNCDSPVSILFGQIVNGAMTTLPSFIIPTTTKKYLLVQTTIRAFVGNYTLYAQGYVINVDRSQPKTVIYINLAVLWPSVPPGSFSSWNSAPYFIEEPQDIYMTAFTLMAYRLPTIQDQQGDMYYITPTFYGAKKFTYLSNQHIVVNGTNADVGVYPIVIRLTDFNQNPMWREYQVTLTVLKGSLPGANPTANITSTTTAGLVTVSFDTALKVPSKWKYLDSSVLLLQIRNEIGYRKLNFTWRIVSFTNSYMLLQLEFQDRMLVSNDIINVRFYSSNFQPDLVDSIEIIFLQQSWFANVVTGVVIRQNYTTSGPLPKQDDLVGNCLGFCKYFIDRFEWITQATTAADLYYKALVAVSTSLSALAQLPNPVWPLVLSLQLVSHVTLATENSPYNVIHFLKAAKILSNFDYFKAFNISNSSNPMYLQDRDTDISGRLLQSFNQSTNDSQSMQSNQSSVENLEENLLKPKSVQFDKMDIFSSNLYFSQIL